MKSLTARVGGIGVLVALAACAAPPLTEVPIAYKPPAIERFVPGPNKSKAQLRPDYGRCFAEMEAYRDKRYGEVSGKTISFSVLADAATLGIFAFSAGAINEAGEVDVGIEFTAKKGFLECMEGYNLKPDDEP